MMKNTASYGLLETKFYLRCLTTRLVSHTTLLEYLHPIDIQIAIDMGWLFAAPAQGWHTVNHKALD